VTQGMPREQIKNAFAAATWDAERCIALEPAWAEGYALKGSLEVSTMEYHKARPW
jgi:hypothetical protein